MLKGYSLLVRIDGTTVSTGYTRRIGMRDVASVLGETVVTVPMFRKFTLQDGSVVPALAFANKVSLPDAETYPSPNLPAQSLWLKAADVMHIDKHIYGACIIYWGDTEFMGLLDADH